MDTQLTPVLQEFLQSGISLGGSTRYSPQIYLLMTWIQNEPQTQFSTFVIKKQLVRRLGENAIPDTRISDILNNLVKANLLNQTSDHLNLHSVQKRQIRLSKMEDIYTITDLGQQTLTFIRTHAVTYHPIKLDPALIDEYLILVDAIYHLNTSKLTEQSGQNLSTAFARLVDIHDQIISGMRKLRSELNGLLARLDQVNDPTNITELIHRLNTEAIPSFERMLSVHKKLYTFQSTQGPIDYITAIVDSGKNDLANLNLSPRYSSTQQRLLNQQSVEAALKRLNRDLDSSSTISANNPQSIYRLNEAINNSRLKIIAHQQITATLSANRESLSATIDDLLDKIERLVLDLRPSPHLAYDREENLGDLTTQPQLPAVIYKPANRPTIATISPHPFGQRAPIDFAHDAKIQEEFQSLLLDNLTLPLDHNLELRFPETRDLLLKIFSTTTPQFAKQSLSLLRFHNLLLTHSEPLPQITPIQIHLVNENFHIELPTGAIYYFQKEEIK